MKQSREFDQDIERATLILGVLGHLVCGSKSLYSKRHPTNVVIFNSNVCTAEGKIWYGDIDFTNDAGTLVLLAQQLNKTLFVLHEMDGRFENENEPRIDLAAFEVRPDGTIKPGGRLEEYVQLCKRGKMNGKWVFKPECRR